MELLPGARGQDGYDGHVRDTWGSAPLVREVYVSEFVRAENVFVGQSLQTREDVLCVLVVKNDHVVDWPSFDDKPVDIMIALLVPEGEAGSTHIRLLSKTAVLLMKDEFKALVRGTDDPGAIAAAIEAGIED